VTAAGLLIALLLAAGGAQAQPAPAHEPVASQPAHEATPAGHEQASPAAPAPEGEHAAVAEHAAEAHGPSDILMHHVLDQEFFGIPSKHMVYFALAEPQPDESEGGCDHRRHEPGIATEAHRLLTATVLKNWIPAATKPNPAPTRNKIGSVPNFLSSQCPIQRPSRTVTASDVPMLR